MDAFFVAVELLDRPELRGHPVVVGGIGTRGVVAAASYEARVYGIHSAMSSVEAQRRCPDAIFLQGRHGRYTEVSERVMEILARFTPSVEPVSLDEAFLDVTRSRLLRRPYEQLGQTIRDRILAEVGLTCSVGIAPGKLVAKLASEAAKPKASHSGPLPGAGVVVVEPADVVAFLAPMSVRNLWGVGPSTGAKLAALGVTTVGDLARLPRTALVGAVGTGVGEHLADLANGIDRREVVADRAPRSIGHEETFATDLHTVGALEREIVRLADGVAGRLRERALAGRTVTLKIRFGDFHTITRARTVTVPLDDAAGIAREAKELATQIDPTPGVRLIGVSVSALVDGATRQLTLDDLDAGSDDLSGGESGPRHGTRHGALSSAVDRVRERFGRDAIAPAVTLDPDGIRVKSTGDRQWGPGA